MDIKNSKDDPGTRISFRRQAIVSGVIRCRIDTAHQTSIISCLYQLTLPRNHKEGIPFIVEHRKSSAHTAYMCKYPLPRGFGLQLSRAAARVALPAVTVTLDSSTTFSSCMALPSSLGDVDRLMLEGLIET
jgi:hypothetical protein